MLKNSKVVLFVTLKSWSGREILDPTTYIRYISSYRVNTVFSVRYKLNLYLEDRQRQQCNQDLKLCHKKNQQCISFAFLRFTSLLTAL